MDSVSYIPEEGTTARLLIARPHVEDIRAGIARDIAALRSDHRMLPGVTVVVVGEDGPSRVYVERILKNAALFDLPGRAVRLGSRSSTEDVVAAIRDQNDDASVAGVIVQMPLPEQVDLAAVIEAIDPEKDIDGIHPRNAGLLALGYPGYYPSCAEAAIVMLHRSSVELAGRHAVVIGRSNVVGKPVELLLLREHATVTVCHRKTVDLASEVRRADVVVVAAGSPGLVHGGMVKPGATVIDCGINVRDGRVVGDVDARSVAAVAGALTPVPGGIGPLTNAVLLRHLARAVAHHSTPA